MPRGLCMTVWRICCLQNIKEVAYKQSLHCQFVIVCTFYVLATPQEEKSYDFYEHAAFVKRHALGEGRGWWSPRVKVKVTLWSMLMSSKSA